MIAPHDPDSGWDYVVIAGVTSPGVVTLSGHDRETGWDVKGATAQDGATSTRTGNPLGLVDMDFHLATDEDFAAWSPFQVLLESSIAGEDPIALETVHPDLQRNHYTALVLVSVGAMRAVPEGGSRVKVTMREHRPPKPKTAKGAQGTKTQGQKTQGDKMIDQAKSELQGLIDEGKKL